MGPKILEITRGIFLYALRVVDVGLIMLSFGLALFATMSAQRWATLGSILARKVSLLHCVLFVIGILSCYGVFSLCGLYTSKRLSTKHAEAIEVLRAMTLSIACWWCIGKLFSILVITPTFLLAFFVIGSASVITARVLLRYALGLIRKHGRNLHHVLILGTNARAIDFARRIEATPERGYRVLGFVDDEWPGLETFHESRFPLCCNCAGLAEFLRANVVDELAIYLPLRSFYERAFEIAKIAEHHGILLRFDTDIFDLKLGRRHVEATDGTPHIMANGNGIDGWQLLLKRVLDVVGSLVLLAALGPLFLIIAALIKLTSHGPVLFRQKRVGLNKRQFTMFKFRTMISTAESIQDNLAHLNEMSGPVFKIKNDPRITSLGRILRKTSIDELPQLFNVLKGDMSLVGPRAMSVRDYQFFNEDWQRRRFSVPPGITCLWQIQGRNSIPFEQWMVMDMEYIDQWSLWLDLKILALTIPAVFRGSGAA
jgi:exopolysaccharide biosynthesis polyprenyl glycosylphosphotransferase